MSEYMVRPSSLAGAWGLYKITGPNKASEIYTGTQSSCYNYQTKLEKQKELTT